MNSILSGKAVSRVVITYTHLGTDIWTLQINCPLLNIGTKYVLLASDIKVNSKTWVNVYGDTI